MAHGIYTPRDFQIAEEMGWHKLTRLGKPKMEDFPEIIPQPLFYLPPNYVGKGKDMVFGNRKFMVPVSTDDMLPVAPPYCGETIVDKTDAKNKNKDSRGTYILFTPREAWAWVTGLLQGTEYNVQSIGMLWNRSVWFISVHLTELKSLSIGDGRETRFQLNFSGGLDRSISPQCELSSTVVVCANTLNISRTSGEILFQERATKCFKDRLDAAQSEIAKAVGMVKCFELATAKLAETACNSARAERIYLGYLTDATTKEVSTKTINTVKSLTHLHKDGIGNKGKTEWDLLNGFTQLFTLGNDDTKNSSGKRFASSEYGGNADTKADFYNALTVNRVSLEEIEERGRMLLAA